MLPPLLVLLVAFASPEKAGAAASLPNESLHYNINWPSGLSLGEASFSAIRGASEGVNRWTVELSLDASVPGYAVSDRYKSSQTAEFCSVEFDRTYAHGKRKSDETLKFDATKNIATRETVNGGKSEIPTAACAKDPLAFLQFVRKELAQGRLPSAQTVVFGAPYQVRVEYTGNQMLKLGDNPVDADRLTATIKGPSTDITIELFFSRDAGRTPLLVRVPFTLGTMSMELAR